MVIKLPNKQRIVVNTNNITRYEPFEYCEEYTDVNVYVIDIYYKGENNLIRIFKGKGIEGEKERDAILAVIDKEMNAQNPINVEPS